MTAPPPIYRLAWPPDKPASLRIAVTAAGTLQRAGASRIVVYGEAVTNFTSALPLHNSIKLADRRAPKVPSVIPPGASIEDDIVPVESVEFVDTQWVTHRLFPTGTGASELLGEELSVFMPLDIDGKVENRTFVFRVEAIK